jgi:carbonic anhydrase
MNHLFRGLAGSRDAMSPRMKALFKDLAYGQSPELLVFTCSDSRMLPALTGGDQPGSIFVVRSVGNIVAPADATGKSIGDVSEASAIEYAVEVLGIRDIAVCGHSNCGAMGAVLKGRHSFRDKAPNLVEWLAHADAHPGHTPVELVFPPNLSEADRLAQMNVLRQLDHVASYFPVKSRKDEVKLHALWFDIGHAMLQLYEPDQRRFVPLDEAEILRLLTPPQGVSARGG